MWTLYSTCIACSILIVKMQRTLFDFCSSQREESDNRMSGEESSSSLVSSDQDPIGDTVTDTQSSTETLTEISEVTTTCLGACCKTGRIVSQISPAFLMKHS